MELGSKLGVGVKGANFAHLLVVGKQPPSATRHRQCWPHIKLERPAVFSSLIDGNSFMDPPAFVDVYLLDYEAS